MTATFNIGTQNAGVVQNVGGDLVIEGGVHASATWQVEQLREAVDRVRREAEGVELPPAQRAVVDATLGAAAQEAAKPKPERDKVGSLLGAATRALTDAGALVGAGSALLQALRAAATVLGPAAGAAMALL
jgi:hypothetical protein